MDIKTNRLPFSIGLEVDKGKMLWIFTKGVSFPAESRNIFTTISSEQVGAEIHILKGSNLFADRNETLARIMVPWTDKNAYPELEIRISINSYGIIEGLIKDLHSSREVQMIIPWFGADDMNHKLPAQMQAAVLKLLSGLISRAEKIMSESSAAYTGAFRQEALQVIEQSREALFRGSRDKLKTSLLFLESVVNEMLILRSVVRR